MSIMLQIIGVLNVQRCKTEYIAKRGIITQYLPKTGKLNLYKYARLWISDDNRLDKYWIRK